MTTDIKLKECPHCGKPPARHSYTLVSDLSKNEEWGIEVYCDNENCINLRQKDIVAHWNTRVPTAKEKALEEKCRILIDKIKFLEAQLLALSDEYLIQSL